MPLAPTDESYFPPNEQIRATHRIRSRNLDESQRYLARLIYHQGFCRIVHVCDAEDARIATDAGRVPEATIYGRIRRYDKHSTPAYAGD